MSILNRFSKNGIKDPSQRYEVIFLQRNSAANKSKCDDQNVDNNTQNKSQKLHMNTISIRDRFIGRIIIQIDESTVYMWVFAFHNCVE